MIKVRDLDRELEFHTRFFPEIQAQLDLHGSEAV